MKNRSNMRYCKGTPDCAEHLEFETAFTPDHATTCIVGVDLLLAGRDTFPCMDGNDLQIAAPTRLEMARYIRECREELRNSAEIKTYDHWCETGLHDLENYIKPGDKVANDIVENLVNAVPPAFLAEYCTQLGEVYASIPGPRHTMKALYSTFHRETRDYWIFDGYCFLCENKNRYDAPTTLDRFIKELEGTAAADD